MFYKKCVDRITPVFISFYRMLKGITNKFMKIVISFLWGGLEEVKKIHLVFCKPKEKGGLGVKDFE